MSVNKSVRRNNRRKRSSKRKSDKNNITALIVSITALVIIAVIGIIIFIKKYAPTNEELPLDEYYTYFSDEDAALIVNDEYEEMDENDTAGDAIITDGKLYIEFSVLKRRIDDAYVFDHTEEVLRYVTDSSVISVPYGGKSYSVDKSIEDFDETIVLAKYNTYYVSAEFTKQYTDYVYTVYDDPSRVVIYKAGYKRDVAKLRGAADIRRLGGPKSKIVKKAEKNEEVTVLDEAGKWRKVATSDGVIGYVKSSRLRDKQSKKQDATLAERTYNHITMDDKICLGWHQVTNAAANSNVADVLANTSGLTVISPTWYYLNDNQGGIADLSDSDYIATAHSKGVKVWGLISNLENSEVDSTTVLNRTTYRDALVNNIVGAAISVGLDGINVDMESLSSDAADGYIEFIRELSLKCEKNDLVLSVDNYVPASFNQFYNRTEQAKYADYIILMAYDEHYQSDDEAGSNASKDFVKDGIEGTLEEVPAEQLVLGMPFYGRSWAVDSSGKLSSEVVYMKNVSEYLSEHSATAEWDDSLGQNYAEFTEDDVTYMFWPEDAKSLAVKLAMMQEYKLAGGAFWKLTFEPDSIWTVIGSYME